MDWQVEYKNDSGAYIIRLSSGQYYFGNGGTFNGYGVSAEQFLRFNPYMDNVAGTGIEPSKAVKKWIEKHKNKE